MSEHRKLEPIGDLASEAQAAPEVAQWFVVVAKQHNESWAEENLAKQGFEVYGPKYLATPTGRPGRPVVARPRPLFPTYLFARVGASVARWQSVFSTRGVHGVLKGAGGSFMPVPDEVIDRIRQEEVDGLVKVLPKAPFARGERVRAAGSPLDALFEEEDDERRAWVLIDICGRKLRQRVAVDRLERA